MNKDDEMKTDEYYVFANFCFTLTLLDLSEEEALEKMKEAYPKANEYEVKILVDRDPNFGGLTGRKVFYQIDDLKTTATLH